jgi:hypothetical protein
MIYFCSFICLYLISFNHSKFPFPFHYFTYIFALFVKMADQQAVNVDMANVLGSNSNDERPLAHLKLSPAYKYGWGKNGDGLNPIMEGEGMEVNQMRPQKSPNYYCHPTLMPNWLQCQCCWRRQA